MNALVANWKTTVCGVLILFVAIVNKVAIPYFDADPVSMPDWEFAGLFVLAGTALLFSADGSKLQALLNKLTPAPPVPAPPVVKFNPRK